MMLRRAELLVQMCRVISELSQIRSVEVRCIVVVGCAPRTAHGDHLGPRYVNRIAAIRSGAR